ncbi:MAG: VOC family protein [Fimbriimonadales bacterium]
MSNCTVCHIEYKSEDLAASQKFCEQIFGWEFRSFGPDMVVFNTPEGHIGGFVAGSRPNDRGGIEVFYKVDSVDATVENSTKLGATVRVAKHAVPGVGWSASILAPDGNEFGLVEFTEQG